MQARPAGKTLKVQLLRRIKHSRPTRPLGMEMHASKAYNPYPLEDRGRKMLRTRLASATLFKA